VSGTATKTFAPGLLDAPQTVTATNDRIYAPCVSATDTSVISGSDSHVFTNARSCNEVSAGPETGTFDWGNGRSSTFAFNRMTTRVAGTDTLEETGTITAGEFAVDTALLSETTTHLDPLACLAPPGVTSTFGPTELQITAP
jgi:hypothetical protein